MEYFRLEHSINLSEIGEFPQCENGKFVSTWNSEHSLVLVYKAKIVDSLIEVPEAILQTKARQTDLVSVIFLDFMLFISNKLKSLIEAKQYPGAQFIETALHRKDGIIVQYWILNPFVFRNEYIDFSQSTIECRPPYPESVSLFKVADRAEYERLFEEGKKNRTKYTIKKPHLYADKINEDFFLLENVDGGIGYYVSENFKNEIIAAGCTGIEFSGLNGKIGKAGNSEN